MGQGQNQQTIGASRKGINSMADYIPSTEGGQRKWLGIASDIVTVTFTG